jgi:hypothetical protein
MDSIYMVFEASDSKVILGMTMVWCDLMKFEKVFV